MATKVYTGITPLQIEIDDLTALPQEICEDLNCGDIIISSGICYVVSSKNSGAMTFAYADDSKIRVFYYEKSDAGVWEYVENVETSLGGKTLYQHNICFHNVNISNTWNGDIMIRIVNSSANAISYEDFCTMVSTIYTGNNPMKWHYPVELYSQFATFTKDNIVYAGLDVSAITLAQTAIIFAINCLKFTENGVAQERVDCHLGKAKYTDRVEELK